MACVAAEHLSGRCRCIWVLQEKLQHRRARELNNRITNLFEDVESKLNSRGCPAALRCAALHCMLPGY